MEGMDRMEKKPIRITDTTIRDGHQSCLATRMRTEDMLPIKKTVLKSYKKGKEPITCRPADLIGPEMEKAKEETKGIAKDLCDTLIYALYPKTGVDFLKWKYGIEPMPEKVKPKTLDDIKREDEAIAKAKAESQKK